MTRRFALSLAALCAAGCALALFAASAFAERAYDSQISGLTVPWGLSIDSSDNVWVTQPLGGNGVIAEYNSYPSQTKLFEQTGGEHYGSEAFAATVDPVNGYLYVLDSGSDAMDVFDPANFVQQWYVGGGYDFGVAADDSGGPSNGRVYATYGHEALVAFMPNGEAANFSAAESYIEGNYITGTPAGPFGRTRNVAVDKQGDIYVVDSENLKVDEFAPSGEFMREFTGAGAPGGFEGQLIGVAVDPTNDNVLVVDEGSQNVVDEFTSSGEYLDQITTGAEGAPLGELHGGIAVNSSGYVYLAEATHNVIDIFTPNKIFPKVTYGAVAGVNPTAVTLNATVDLNGGPEVTSCQFEYGATTSYGSTVPCAQATPLTGATQISAEASGLTAEETYHYRVVLLTSNGVKKGEDQPFLAPPPDLPRIDSTSASSVSQNAATLDAEVDPGFGPTVVRFEYGKTIAYGSRTYPSESIGSDGQDHPASVDISGLSPGSTYHFRAIATNFAGTVKGPDQTFTTPDLPSVAASAASEVTQTTARISADLYPGFLPTTYHFDYGLTGSYGSSTPESASIGSDDSAHSVGAVLSGLMPATTYHYRVVATNAIGSADGPDQTFTTTATPPTITPPPPHCKPGLVPNKHGSCVRPHHHHKRKHHRRSHR